ncbi:11879_t:CDS:1, partial [Gigaspora rosea]
PDPIISNHSLEIEIGGTFSAVTIEEGAHYVSMIFLNDQLLAIIVQDFCKGLAEPSGSHCPVSPGKFYYKHNIFAQLFEFNNVTITQFVRTT